MNRLLLDFESYYDNDYSLSKMPTMAYVRDPRWQCLGCGVKWNDEDARYIQPGDLPGFFASVPWGDTVAIAHNAQFDGAVLWEHYGHTPRWWIDTKMLTQWAISQGYLPAGARTSLAWWGERVRLAKGDTAQAVQAGGDTLAGYGLVDIEIMRRALAELMRYNPPDLELQLMDLHVRMATEPVLELDEGLLQDAARAEPPPEVERLRKNDLFVAALRARGVEPGTKTSPRTGKETYAFAKTDAFMQSLARHSDPVVRKLHELRTQGGSNIVRTRAQRLLSVGRPLPVPLQYYGAHTGRSSGLDSYNLQNLPRDGDLRHSVMAPAGHCLVVVDLAQIEVRVLAWLAGERPLLSAFDRGEDPYVRFGADHLYRHHYTGYADFLARLRTGCPEVKHRRQVSKAAVLALGFHQGPAGFLKYCGSFGIPTDEATAQQAVDAYRRAYPRIMAFGHECLREVQATGRQILSSGRNLTYPDLRQAGREQTFERPLVFSKQHRNKRDTVKLWAGSAVNNRVQAEARDVVMWQTIELAKRWKVAMSVHDEAVLVVPDALAENARDHAARVFGTPPPWAPGLPVKGEPKIVRRYGEAK